MSEQQDLNVEIAAARVGRLVRLRTTDGQVRIVRVEHCDDQVLRTSRPNHPDDGDEWSWPDVIDVKAANESDAAGFGSRELRGRRDNYVDQDSIRAFVLDLAAEGAELSWQGYLDRIVERYGKAVESKNLRGMWNLVSNQLNREGLLIVDPAVRNSVMRPAAQYPHVRRLSRVESTREIESLIDSGGWRSGEKGLRLWMVAERIGTVSYDCIYDAMHAMNERKRRIETRGQFWYVKD